MSDQQLDDPAREQAHRQLVRDWLTVAQADMENAAIVLAGAPSSYTHVAVLSEQAIEHEPDFANRTRPAAALAQYAVAPRYPDGYEPMDLASASDIYAVAEDVWVAVTGLLTPFIGEE